jgi:hypothetical protein
MIDNLVLKVFIAKEILNMINIINFNEFDNFI